jgi:hypothetical protein
MAQPQANLRPIAPQRGLASRDGHALDQFGCLDDHLEAEVLDDLGESFGGTLRRKGHGGEPSSEWKVVVDHCARRNVCRQGLALLFVRPARLDAVEAFDPLVFLELLRSGLLAPTAENIRAKDP